ncbi:MAG: 5'-3' exonuclease [Actinomycetota bacterium]
MLTLLIDASSLIYRAWFALPDSIRAPDGRVVNAAHGFLDMLAGMISSRKPDGLACGFDASWRPEWRVALLPEYKAHRVAAAESEDVPTPDDQEGIIREILGVAGIACADAHEYEAEDVIGTLAERGEGRRAIVSGDRDLFALVRDPDIFVLYPRRGVSDLVVIDEQEIAKRYDIPGDRYFDFAVLRGDPSDGLGGVPGIGEETAAALVRKHGSLAGIVDAAKQSTAGALGKVAAHLDYIERAEKTVRIATGIDLGVIHTLLPPSAPEGLREAGEAHGLNGPVRRLADALDAREHSPLS